MASKAEDLSFWEKMRTVTTLLASLVIPLVVVAITQLYTRAEGQRQREARYVELAIEILRDNPREETQAIRNWAIEIVGAYSPITLPVPALEELKLEPIRIRAALDGNTKSSGELMTEVEQLMNNWSDLNKKLDDEMKKLHDEASKEKTNLK
jgi:hypothetical protein